MSSDTGSPSQTDDGDAPVGDGAGEGCPSAERLPRMLERLAEAGLEIALAIERRVKDAPPDQPLTDLTAAATAYARVARAVRLCALLQTQLIQRRQEAEEAARQAEAQGRPSNRDRALRIVRRVARDHCHRDPFSVSALTREARERLDDDDLYGLVATRPVGELVALICRDLGLQPDWDALGAEPWAQAEIASGAEGSPFLDDEPWDEVPDGEAAPGPAPPRPARPAAALQAALHALARDPDVLAAARRDSG